MTLALVLAGAGCGDRWKEPEPGLVVSASGRLTTEAGGTALLSVSLAVAPRGEVTVEVHSSDSGEGLILEAGASAPRPSATLVFTPGDWSTQQAVTLVGVDDDAADGDAAFGAIVLVAASEDSRYAAVRAVWLGFTNRDDDTPGIVLSRTSLVTWERWEETASFTIALAARPAEWVTLEIVSGAPLEGRLRASTLPNVADASIRLVFTPSDWATPREVTVVGQPDGVADGDVAFELAFQAYSGDGRYERLPMPVVNVVNRDVDGASVLAIDPAALGFPEGETRDVCVSVSGTPEADVTVPIRSGDATEILIAPAGSGGPFAEALSLTLPGSAAAPSACFTVRAVNDGELDGHQITWLSVGPTASADGAFDGQPARTVEASIFDVNYTSFVVAVPGPLEVSEGGGTVEILVYLSSRPTADVVVPVRAEPTTEALVSLGGGPPVPELTLTISPAGWDVHVPVTIHGTDDAIYEPDPAHPFTVWVGPSSSADPAYVRTDVAQLAGTNADDEFQIDQGSAAVAVPVDAARDYAGTVGTGVSHYVITGLPGNALVEVAGGTAPLHVEVDEDEDVGNGRLCEFTTPAWERGACLATVPAGGEVRVRVDGSATARGATFTLTVSPFEASTDVPKTVVSGFGPVTSTLTLTGAPTSIARVRVFMEFSYPYFDTFFATLTSPGGTSIRIATRPYYADAIFPLTVFDDLASETFPYVQDLNGTVQPLEALETFAGEDGNGTWSLAVEAGFTYWNEGVLANWGIWAEPFDGDWAGYWVWPSPDPLLTSEGGVTSTIEIALSSRPAAPVQVDVATLAEAEALLSTGAGAPERWLQLTFEPDAWDVRQAITVHGVDDLLFEPGDPHPFRIQVGPISSADPAFNSGFHSYWWGTNVDGEFGLDQGSAGAPLAVQPGVLQAATVGTGTSYYVIAGLPARALVAVSAPTSDLGVTVDDDADGANGTLCSYVATTGSRGACLVDVPGSGAVQVRVDGGTTTRGASFDLRVSPFVTAADLPASIPPASSGSWAESALTVSGGPATIHHLRVLVDVQHPQPHALLLWLVSPGGTTLGLSENPANGVSPGFPLTVFDDDAPVYSLDAADYNAELRPAVPLAALTGQVANGVWRLQVRETYDSGYVGSVVDWGLWIE
jgi:subtilisin-like proprotein convertase family protein